MYNYNPSVGGGVKDKTMFLRVYNKVPLTAENNYDSWYLSSIGETTYDPPIEMKFMYIYRTAYKAGNRTRYTYPDCFGWFPTGTGGTFLDYIYAEEDSAGRYQPVAISNFVDTTTRHPITYSNYGLSIESYEVDGQEIPMVCTRSNAFPTQVVRNLAYADELPSVPSNISEFNNDVGYITASASAITSLESSVASLASSVAAIDVTKIYDNAQNKTKYVNGNCEVFNWEMIYTPWVFSDGNTREVIITYTEDPYPETPWLICGSDYNTLPYSNCFYSTKEEAETTLSFTYPI